MAAPPYMSKKPPKDLGSPGGFGGKPKMPPAPMDAGEPDADDMSGGGAPAPAGGGGGVVLSLDQIGYHDEPHACALCKHYGQDGMCEVAQSQVNPDGGCDVFAGQDEGAGAGAPAPMGAGMPMGGAPSGLPS